MTLLERFEEEPPHFGEQCLVTEEEIRRAIAVAQAVEHEASKPLTALSNVGQDAPWYARQFIKRAEELLRGK